MSLTNTAVELSDNQRNTDRNESGEGTRLWGNDNSWSRGSGDSDLVVADNAGGGQYDIHIDDRQIRSPAEEMPVDQDLHNTGPSTSATQTTGSINARRSGMSPFCPCFSPTISDSEDDEPQQNHALSVTDQMRQRLVVSAFAASNPTPQQAFFPSQEVPVVHRVVEYAHHLVPDLDTVYASPYYWGEMDRHKAEELLEGKPEGTFLLRDSAQTEYLFSVSFRRYQRTLHARIEQGNHRFGFDILDSSVFSSPSVTGLIENYKDPTRCLFFEPQLTYPLPRSLPFSLETLCCSKIASCTSYGNVSNLLLPTFLKAEIRKQHFDVPVRTINNEH